MLDDIFFAPGFSQNTQNNRKSSNKWIVNSITGYMNRGNFISNYFRGLNRRSGPTGWSCVSQTLKGYSDSDKGAGSQRI